MSRLTSGIGRLLRPPNCVTSPRRHRHCPIASQPQELGLGFVHRNLILLHCSCSGSMATSFDRWEKDPFFPAAEEVQESADRMESVYKAWIQERKDDPNPKNELRQDLQTALGTAKWQLDELDRAVKSNDAACLAANEIRARHKQFVDAIGNQISTVESSLKESNFEKGENEHSWIRLNEGERDELALFLTQDGSEMVNGIRRTASACADIEAWKILVPNEDLSPNLLPAKIPSLSCVTNALESTSEVTWSKYMFRKCKGVNHHQQDDFESIPLRDHQLSQGCNANYDRTKSCLSSCGHEAYEKQFYGWFGALRRQLQRSQYQIQYGRPFQIILWVVVLLLIGSYVGSYLQVL